MQHTLRYRSSRRDIWHWYWQAWRARRWKFHVAIALVMSISMPVPRAGGFDYAGAAGWFVIALSVLVVTSALFSQILFKRVERILVVDARGWSTQIGRRSGARTWAEVAAITEEPGRVIIDGTNGNALIIPEAAFGGAAGRRQFLADIRQWKAAYAG